MNSELMTADAAIAIIDEWFPIDYDNANTIAIGKELLLQAIANADFNWRDLPAPVLQEYARLCEDEQVIAAVTEDLIKKEILFHD